MSNRFVELFLKPAQLCLYAGVIVLLPINVIAGMNEAKAAAQCGDMFRGRFCGVLDRPAIASCAPSCHTHHPFTGAPVPGAASARPLATAGSKWVCAPPSDRSLMRATTRWPSASLPDWNASSWPGIVWKTKTEARRALFTWIETTLCGAVSDCDNIKSIEKTGGNIINSLLAATGKKNRYEPHLEKMQGTKFPREGL